MLLQPSIGFATASMSFTTASTTTHNILHPLQASAAAEAERNWHIQEARLSSAACSASRPKGSGNVNDNPYKTKGAEEPCIGPHPGFSWVSLPTVYVINVNFGSRVITELQPFDRCFRRFIV